MAYVVEPGTIEVMVGSSSSDLPHRTTLEIVGETVDVAQAKAYFCPTSVK